MSLADRPLADNTDVLVIGGGPAGSTVSALLARRGWRVTLLEKDHHPRFHIGESLLPMNVPIFQRLGVLGAVRAIGVRKLGADFPAHNERGYNVFRFDRMLRPGAGYAFQVRRDQLDQLLFEHAVARGVNARQAIEVTRLELDEAGVRAHYAGPEGAGSLRAAYVVDASGRDTLLGTHFKLKRRHRQHQSAALFAHFQGVELRPGEDAGNLSVYRFDQGWIWLIPLPDGRVSIGAVCRPEYLKTRRGSREEFLLRTLESVPAVRERMRGARVVEHLQATGNYSYECRRMCGRRWIMVGDACAFLDPIFSTGVYLAMWSAEQAVEVVDGALREPRRERSLQRRYVRGLRRGMRLVSWFIVRFTTPAMRALFSEPRNYLGVEQAMISMLGGDFFESAGVRWRLELFKCFYYLTVLGVWRESLADRRERRRQLTVSFPTGAEP